jgi:hypothetical protein
VQNGFEIVKNLLVTEADDSEPALGQPFSPGGVVFLLTVVDAAISLDDQLMSVTIKI